MKNKLNKNKKMLLKVTPEFNNILNSVWRHGDIHKTAGFTNSKSLLIRNLLVKNMIETFPKMEELFEHVQEFKDYKVCKQMIDDSNDIENLFLNK